MEGEHEPAFSLPNGKCPNGFHEGIVERERKSPAPIWQCLLYGVLNVVGLILFIILICTYIGGCSEQGETPITEKPEGQPGEGQVCVPCSMLPPRLREKNKTRCCITEDLPLKKLVTAYVDSAMASRFQPDKARVWVPDFHTNMDENAIRSGKILTWKEAPVGSPNNTHLRIEKSGYYFVSTDVSFDFRKPKIPIVGNASFCIVHWEKATGQTSRPFLNHSVPICAKDAEESVICIVPNEVGGIRPLKEGDELFVETSHPEAVCHDSTSFGFQMISEEGPIKKKM